MTTIAWDGQTLAADCQGNNNGMKQSVGKIRLLRISSAVTVLVALSGDASHFEPLCQWLQAGGKPEDYPDFQAGERCSRLYVVHDKKLAYYEGTAYPIHVKEPFFAGGSGRDYAIGAMAMGASAILAVKIASQYDCHTGLGVESIHSKTFEFIHEPTTLDYTESIGVP